MTYLNSNASEWNLKGLVHLSPRLALFRLTLLYFVSTAAVDQGKLISFFAKRSNIIKLSESAKLYFRYLLKNSQRVLKINKLGEMNGNANKAIDVFTFRSLNQMSHRRSRFIDIAVAWKNHGGMSTCIIRVLILISTGYTPPE